MDRSIPKTKPTRNRLLKLRSNLPELLVESILISFGVLLAFAIDNWKAQNKLRHDTGVVLENLRNELIGNRSIVLEWLSYHDSLCVSLNKLKTSDDLSIVMRPSLQELYPEPNVSYLLQQTAWQAAHSTQVVRYFNYVTTHNLTHGYASQQDIEEMRNFIFSKLHELPVSGSFDPKTRLRLLESLFKELSRKERYLLSVYRDALIEVDKELTSGDF